MHANLPKIAKRWERDYAHGGILDINEREEIIDDGGNEIELTDYNAAFDDPNDLSTGVKSLFQAKDGGTPRRRYFTGAYGGGGDKDEGPPGGGATSQGSGRDYSPAPSDRGPRDAPDRFGPTTTTTTTTTGGEGYQDPIITLAERKRKEDLKQMANTYEDTWGKWNDKYDKLNKYSYSGSGVTKRAKLTDQNYNEDRAALEKKFGKSLIK